MCSEQYFRTLEIKHVAGRLLSEQDVIAARKVAVVNQTFVKKFFGNENPIGRSVRIADLATFPDPVPDPTFEIIGIVADAKNQGLQEPAVPELWIPYTVTGFGERGVLVRTASAPMSLLNAVRKEIWAVDRNVALTLTGTLEDFMKRFSYSEPRLGLLLLGVFALNGLVLVGIGVYSVMAYAVSRQTHEIGIRMALGAMQGNVIRLVLRTGLKLIAMGLVIGLAASVGFRALNQGRAVGRVGIRPCHARDRGLRIRGGWAGSLPVSSQTGNAGRPAGCLALRVKRSSERFRCPQPSDALIMTRPLPILRTR